MKTNKNSQDEAIKQEIMEAMTLTMRGLYWLGCLCDKGLKRKKSKSGEMKILHWRLKPIWYNPILIVWVVVYNIFFGIVNIVRNIWESLTQEILISPQN